MTAQKNLLLECLAKINEEIAEWTQKYVIKSYWSFWSYMCILYFTPTGMWTRTDFNHNWNRMKLKKHIEEHIQRQHILSLHVWNDIGATQSNIRHKDFCVSWPNFRIWDLLTFMDHFHFWIYLGFLCDFRIFFYFGRLLDFLGFFWIFFSMFWNIF